jgi:hypothetical protein
VNGHERLDALAAELDRLGEELAEAAMDMLRNGLAEGSDAGAAVAGRQERLVNRARLAVEKAVSLLVQAAEVGDIEAESHVAQPGRARGRRSEGGAHGDENEDY